MYIQKLRFARDVNDDPVVYIFMKQGNCQFVYRRELLKLNNNEFRYWLDAIRAKDVNAANFFQNWYVDYYFSMPQGEREVYYAEFDQVEIYFDL